MKPISLYIITIVILWLISISNAKVFAFPNLDVNQPANASLSKYELGKRYIKLGNTYREAKDYENALKYLNKGQAIFKKQTNSEEKYWYAVAQEYFAYYYRDINQFQPANMSLSDAEQIFNDVITQEDGSPTAISHINIVHKKLFGRGHNIINTISNNGINNKHGVINKDDGIINHLSSHLSNHFTHPNNTNSKQYIVNLDNRNLTDFPGSITNNRIDNLSMANNLLTKLPERINFFNTLVALNLSHNRLNSLAFMSNLKMLNYLNLSNNQLNEINASISNLNALKYLNLANNPNLNYISNEIFNLTNLIVLDISNTAIPRYVVDDLIAKLPNTNIIYNNISDKQLNSNDNNLNADEFEEDDTEFEEDNDDWEAF